MSVNCLVGELSRSPKIYLKAFLVLENIFKWFLPYMGMAAILTSNTASTEDRF